MAMLPRDGTLAAYDPRLHKPVARSDQLDDELLSLAVVKNGSKVVCGSQEGVLNIYSWGLWADISDRFPGHPNSIDTLAVVNEEMLLTGSSDGLIRSVGRRARPRRAAPPAQGSRALAWDERGGAGRAGAARVIGIHPNKMLGVVGEHGEFPIERIKLAPNNKYLASCSHDGTVKFWNIEYLFDPDAGTEDGEAAEGDADAGGGSDGDDSDDSDAMQADAKPGPALPQRGRPKGKGRATTNDFFADL